MRILIVEDDKKVGAFLQKGLKEEQYAVDICRDGRDGLEYAQINSYDVIILDVMLPGKDGFAVCRELRESRVFTPVLMLTAKDSVEDKVAGFGEGADDYLTKPFSFEELLARLRALLRRTQDYKPTVLRVGDLELDPFRRQAVRAGRRISLTGKEYALLERPQGHDRGAQPSRGRHGVHRPFSRIQAGLTFTSKSTVAEPCWANQAMFSSTRSKRKR